MSNSTEGKAQPAPVATTLYSGITELTIIGPIAPAPNTVAIASTTLPSVPSSARKPSDDALAGEIVGAVVALLLVIAIVGFFAWRRRRRHSPSTALRRFSPYHLFSPRDAGPQYPEKTKSDPVTGDPVNSIQEPDSGGGPEFHPSGEGRYPVASPVDASVSVLPSGSPPHPVALPLQHQSEPQPSLRTEPVQLGPVIPDSEIDRILMIIAARIDPPGEGSLPPPPYRGS
ncbi:hypothetical protein HYDPIDRAFT_26759 [Hydnomerulius pinastri MD-312]|nr:hypothetical protein HYDPIDRAFT_26759 [Hydnomerulius pinastri MD-312]